MTREIPDGVVTMMVTPMTEDGEINFDAFYDEMDWCAKQGSQGIVVTPSIGECAVLTDSERMECLETCKGYMQEQHPGLFTIATIATTNTPATQYYAGYAKSLGYDAGQLNPPYYWVPDDEEVYRYYNEVAEVGLPLVVCNNPRLSKFNIKPKLMARLAKIPGVIAIKAVKTDRHVDLEPLFYETRIANPKVKIYTTFRVFATGLALRSNGGFINVFAVPFCMDMWNLYRTGHGHDDDALVKIIQIMLNDAFPICGKDNSRHIGTAKMAASVVTGIDMGPPRKPYLLPEAKFENHMRLYFRALYRVLSSKQLSTLKNLECISRTAR